jgi:hypothetical protein
VGTLNLTRAEVIQFACGRGESRCVNDEYRPTLTQKAEQPIRWNNAMKA